MENNGNTEKPKSIKMIIVGSVSVGKTSLVTRYATGKFQDKTKSTSNASFVNKIKIVDNVKYELKLWDTAGQEKYKSLTKIFIKDAKIAILVYAINDEKSFNDLNDWLTIVKEINNENLILGIAANKADLYKIATVTDEQGKKYAQEIGATWRSTSSLLDDSGIDELVDILFKQYLNSEDNSISQDRIKIDDKDNIEKGASCCGGKKENKKKKKSSKDDKDKNEENAQKSNDDEDF